MVKRKQKLITIHLPDDLLSKLMEIKKTRGVSMNTVIVAALRTAWFPQTVIVKEHTPELVYPVWGSIPAEQKR